LGALRTITPQMFKRHVTEDRKAHPLVCPTSRCTYGSTEYVTKKYVSDSD